MKFGRIKILVGLGIFIVAFSLGFLVSEIVKSSPLDNKINNLPVSDNAAPLELSRELKVQGKDGATCTTSNEFVIVISGGHSQNKNNLRYRVFCGEFDSKWVSSGTIKIPNLVNPGAYTARVKVSDDPANPNAGNIKETTFTFFKIEA